MYLKKTYISLFIALLNMILLQAQEDLSVNVVLKDRNISLAQLKPSKNYFDKSYHAGYFFSVNVSVVNNTADIKYLRFHNMCGYNTWKIEGDVYIRRIVDCLKNINLPIILHPKESFETHLPLWFYEAYLNKKLSFKIGFRVDHHIYWSKIITINENKKTYLK